MVIALINIMQFLCEMLTRLLADKIAIQLTQVFFVISRILYFIFRITSALN